MSRETAKSIKEDARLDWAISAARAEATQELKDERAYLDSDQGIKIMEDLAVKIYNKYEPYGLSEDDAKRLVRQSASHVARFRRNRDEEGIVGGAKQHAQDTGMNQASQELFGSNDPATVMSLIGKPLRKMIGTGEYSRKKRPRLDSVQTPTFAQFFNEGLKSELLLLRALEYIERVEAKLADKSKPEEPKARHIVQRPFSKDTHTSFSNNLGSFINK